MISIRNLKVIQIKYCQNFTATIFFFQKWKNPQKKLQKSTWKTSRNIFEEIPRIFVRTSRKINGGVRRNCWRNILNIVMSNFLEIIQQALGLACSPSPKGISYGMNIQGSMKVINTLDNFLKFYIDRIAPNVGCRMDSQ